MGGWLDELVHDPGLNAGYRRGRVAKTVVKLHFTVGRDSRALIRDNGLAQFLLPKVGVPFQFAESDAVCFESCEWNSAGPGLEFERMSWDEPLTDDQIQWGGYIIRTLHEQDGYPLVYHGGVRLPVGSPFRGYANHGSLVHHACDQHTDGITADDFARMIEGDALTPEQEAKLGLWMQQQTAIILDYIDATQKEERIALRKQLKKLFAEHEASA